MSSNVMGTPPTTASHNAATTTTGAAAAMGDSAARAAHETTTTETANHPHRQNSEWESLMMEPTDPSSTTPEEEDVSSPFLGNISNGTNPSTPTTTTNFTERLRDKILALLWVAVAICVGYTAQVPTVLFHRHHADPSDDAAPRPVRWLLQVVALLVGINVVLILYLTVYVPWVVRKPLPPNKSWSDVWPIYCPRVIPTLTLTGLLAFVLLIRATWPVWGFLAPAVLSIEFLGCLFTLHFVPWF